MIHMFCWHQGKVYDTLVLKWQLVLMIGYDCFKMAMSPCIHFWKNTLKSIEKIFLWKEEIFCLSSHVMVPSRLAHCLVYHYFVDKGQINTKEKKTVQQISNKKKDCSLTFRIIFCSLLNFWYLQYVIGSDAFMYSQSDISVLTTAALLSDKESST
jgi:hypothetical protein